MGRVVAQIISYPVPSSRKSQGACKIYTGESSAPPGIVLCRSSGRTLITTKLVAIAQCWPCPMDLAIFQSSASVRRAASTQGSGQNGSLDWSSQQGTGPQRVCGNLRLPLADSYTIPILEYMTRLPRCQQMDEDHVCVRPAGNEQFRKSTRSLFVGAALLRWHDSC